MKTDKKPKKWLNDIILAGVFITLAAVFFLVFKLNAEEGEYVNILVNGKVEYTLELNEDSEKEVNTEYGKNIVSVKNGEVLVREADCPDKICVEHRAISKTGESIICLPNKLVVEIAGGNE